jgi:hypothetical protein
LAGVGGAKAVLSIQRQWQALYEKGFSWLLSSETVLRFRYAAGLDKPFPAPVYSAERRAVIYAGDMPEFALDNLTKAKEAGISIFTVHSMMPLPITFERVLPQIDPVLLGWMENPQIDWTSKRTKILPGLQAVVIAIWDKDKELEVL